MFITRLIQAFPVIMISLLTACGGGGGAPSPAGGEQVSVGEQASVEELIFVEGGASTGGAGSGGGGGTVSVSGPLTSPEATTLSLSYSQVRGFTFDWVDVSSATEYRLFENQTGISGYSQAGANIAAGVNSTTLTVPLHQRLSARYLLQSCNILGCTDSNEVSITEALTDSIGYFKASNTNGSDSFGESLSLSADGSTLVVGATGERSNTKGVNGNQSDNSATSSGAVYVYTRNGTNWIQQAYIKASNTEAGDRFGHSLSLSSDGNTLAVGAYLEDSNATGINGGQMNNDATNSGAVYIFTRSGLVWSQEAYIKASNSDTSALSGDLFGEDLMLSADGNTLAVGASQESSNTTGINGDQSNNGALYSGAAYVFSRSASVWAQQAYIKASNTEERDYFGRALSLSADGNTLAVGAYGEDSNAMGIGGDQANNLAGTSGAAYVFTRVSNTWTQHSYIKASNTEIADYFGEALSLSGDGKTLVVGAYGEDSDSVGINGDQFNSNAPSSGAAYIYAFNGISWTQSAYVKSSNTGQYDNFGIALSLNADGDRLAVGAHNEDSSARINGDQSDNSIDNAGAAYVFNRSGAVWSQKAYIKPSYTGAFDWFGLSLSLSADGNTLAIGAEDEDSSAIGIGGNQTDNSAVNSGAVYLY